MLDCRSCDSPSTWHPIYCNYHFPFPFTRFEESTIKPFFQQDHQIYNQSVLLMQRTEGYLVAKENIQLHPNVPLIQFSCMKAAKYFGVVPGDQFLMRTGLTWRSNSVPWRTLFSGTDAGCFYGKTILISRPLCSQALQGAANTLWELQHWILSVLSVWLGCILASEMPAI